MGTLRRFLVALVSILLLSWLCLFAKLHDSIPRVSSPRALPELLMAPNNVFRNPQLTSGTNFTASSIPPVVISSAASSAAPMYTYIKESVRSAPEARVSNAANISPDRAIEPLLQTPNDFKTSSTAILVLVYNRVNYFRQCIAALRALPEFPQYKLVISQDGNDQQMTNAINEVKASIATMIHIRHAHPPKPYEEAGVLFFIASHYKFALDSVFNMGLSHVIVLEDDLLVSPDFLRMFEALAPILDRDPSVLCISSFNDNGFGHLHLPPNLFLRTRYFPGLGWMIRSDVWIELSPKFPLEAWDHWMRIDSQHKGRDCIIPYLSRNRNIGEEGSTVESGIFERLKKMPRNEDATVTYGAKLPSIVHL
jgi:hypothetical protein